jgi:hypothetical protein
MAAGVSKRAAAVIDRALAREPHRRYPSMAAFGRALAQFQLENAIGHTGELATRSHVRPVAPMRTACSIASAVITLCMLSAKSAGSTDGHASAAREATAVSPQVLKTLADPPAVAPSPLAEVARPAEDMPRRKTARRLPPSAAKAPVPFEHEATTGLPVATEW